MDNDNMILSKLPVYGPALYRYLLCMALSGSCDWMEIIQDYFRSDQSFHRSGQMLDNVKELITTDIPDSRGKIRRIHHYYCGSDESAFGLLLPLSAAFGKNCNFNVAENLMDDSMFWMLKILKMHGVRHELVSKKTMRVWGQMTAGTFMLPSGIDPGFLSGLLMALPLLKDSSTIIIDGLFQPEIDVNLTLKALERSGINVMLDINTDTRGQEKGIYIGATFKIPGSQTYSLDIDTLPGDNWPYEQEAV